MKPVHALKILVIEDDRDLAAMLKLLLETRLSAQVTIAENCASARNILSSSSLDLVTLDFRLPDGNGLELLEEITLTEYHPPVVMVTGKGDEETAVRAFHSGASGYVMKDERLAVMLPAILEKALALKRTERALQESEERYRTIFENTGAATLIVEDDTTISLVNMEAAKLYGYSKDELEGKKSWTEFVHPEDVGKVLHFHHLRRLDPSTVPKGYEYRLINRKGETRYVAVFAELLPGTRRSIASLLDITARKTAVKYPDEYFRALIENSADIIAVLDGNGTIRYQSPSVKSQLGYEPEELNGRSVFDLIHPDDVASANAALSRSFNISRETSPYIELRIRHKNGSWRDFAGMGRSMLANPSVRGIILNARDITERREMEEGLRQSEEIWKSLVTNLPEYIYVFDKEGRFLFLNHSLQGHSTGELMGSSLFEYLEDSSFPILRQPLEAALKTGKKQRFEHRAMVEGGQTRFYEGDAIPIGDENGITGLIVVARDLTERKETEEALQESEERYRTIFENAGGATIITRNDTVIALANCEFEKLTGYSRDEIEGKMKEADFVDAADLERVLEFGRLRRLDPVAVPRNYEVRVRARSGELRDVVASVDLIPGTDLIVTSLLDITARKNAERALKDSELLYKTLVNTSPEAITATDLDGNITFVSDQTLTLHGFNDPQELLGRSAFDLIAPEDRERAAVNMQNTWDVGKGEGIEYKLLKKDGSVFYGELSSSVVRDAQGQPGGFIAATRDITRRKRSEEALRRANAELEAFAGTVSHDLTGPLANIQMASQTLMDILAEPLTDERLLAVIQLAEALHDSSERSIKLAEKLLKLAEAGQEPREVAPVDVREVVERILEDRAAAIEERGIRVEIGSDLGKVAADYTHMYQLFTNLIGNAIQYNDSAMPAIEVVHLGDGDGGSHRYLVHDNGAGILADRIEKIFEPFVKGTLGGTGIGLAIVEKIIKVYGGSIRAYNDDGACFEFVLRDFRE